MRIFFATFSPHGRCVAKSSQCRRQCINNRIKPADSINAIHVSVVFTIDRSYPVIVISSSSPTFKTADVFAGKVFEVGSDDLDSFPV